MDALSNVIAAIRLTSNAFLDVNLSAPWCISSQIAPEDCAPYGSMPAQIIAYHYVVTGRLFLSFDGESPVKVEAGQVILIPRNDRHVLGSSQDLKPAIIDHLIRPADGSRPAGLRIGGGGEETHVICGYMGCETPNNPLLTALPKMLKINIKDDSSRQLISDSFRYAVDEFAEGGLGSSTILSKLAELLFVEAIRRYLITLPNDQDGWLAGLRDAKVGKALSLLHSQPNYAWTAAELAREVNLSRSAFAERFLSLVGMPPIRYLTNWRMQLAAAKLRETPLTLSQIAYEIGYESEAAFNRAFKTAFGVSPGKWRKRIDK